MCKYKLIDYIDNIVKTSLVLTECDNMSKNGLDTTHKILKLLALKKEMPQFDIPEKLGKAYSTIFIKLKKLEQKKLVKVVRTQTSKKRGKPKKIFGLTLFGWLICYGQNVLTAEHIPRLVEAFKDEVPLVFGKWDYFKKESVEKIAEKHLMNTMKICEFKHQSELIKNERIKKSFKSSKTMCNKDSFNKLFSEKYLAAEITDVFLFFGLTVECSIEYDALINSLSDSERIKLREVFNRNKQLNFYRTWIGRNPKWSHLNFDFEFSGSISDGERKEFFDYPWQKFFDSEKYNRKLIDMVEWKLDQESGFKTPFDKIVNAIFEDDYFSATFELCKLYEIYPFISVDEIYNKIFTCMQFLAIYIKTIKHKTKYHNDYKKSIDKATLEILAALHFFDIKTTQVWFMTFGQLTLNMPLKKFEQNKERLKPKALAFTESYIKKNDLSLDDSSTIFKNLLTEPEFFVKHPSSGKPFFCY